jgi:hypothetical protein
MREASRSVFGSKACALRELSLDSKKSPGFLKGRGFEFDNGETLEVSYLTITLTLQRPFGSAAFGWPAGFALPFQIFRLPGRRGTE